MLFKILNHLFFKDESQKIQLPDTELSIAIDKLMLQWAHLLSQIPTSVGIIQPTDDHIKESAEIVVRQVISYYKHFFNSFF